ncbi:MAG: hypothetical protein A3F41_05255 [Coxiella sp. RIFCSPHIGHO2_12_FULL_44_14]|nr:MAG: hypothetical protein A3F41_05255 [Coxiella sp. RIFCSPHIGHO2_12_FULL_44_14]
MKERLLWLVGITCVCITGLAWAQNAQQRVNILHVKIVGLPDAPLKNVLQRLNDQQQLIQYHFNTNTLLRFYRTIPQEIQLGIQPYGYFQSTVQSHIRNEGNVWYSDFTVSPGPRVKFTQLDFQVIGAGQKDPDFQRLYSHFPVKVGHYFNAEQYKKAKEMLFDIASARGYFRAKMLHSVVYIDLRTFSARVVIHFDTGPRFYFGSTTFSPTPFNESFLNRFLQYQAGKPYEQYQLQNTRQGLANSNYFQQVIITPEPDQTRDFHVPIHIDVTPQLKKQYSFGAGYGTDTGLRALISIDYRWVNRYGHRFNTYLRASQFNSELLANYYIPGYRPESDQYVFTGGLLSQDQETGSGKSGRLSVGYETVTGAWQQSISLVYLRERYNLVNLPKINTSMLYPMYTLQRYSRDNAVNPTRGFNFVGRVLGASKDLLSKTNFVQTRADTKFLVTLFDHTRLLLRASVGYTAIKDLVNLPLSLQLFAGGAESIRGYRYNSIGPGQQLFVGSFEIQQKIKGGFYLTAFFDAGNVNNDIIKHPLKQGVGPGLAWISPIGMLEVTFATAISQPNRPWVIQFSMGPTL